MFSIGLEKKRIGLHYSLIPFPFQLFRSPFLQPKLAPAEKTIRLGPGCRPRSAFEWLDPFPWGLHTHFSNLSCAILIQHRA